MPHPIPPRFVIGAFAISAAFVIGSRVAAQSLIDANPYVSGGTSGPYSAYCLTHHPGVWYAQRLTVAFETGATAWNMSSVNLTLQMASGSSSGFTAAIFTSTSNNPDDWPNFKPASQLVSLNFPGSITGKALYTFLPATSTTLSANTTYWITLTPPLTPECELYWLRSEGSSRYNGSQMAFSDTRPYFDVWNVGYGGPAVSFEVYGTAIPEPSVFAAIVGLAAGAGAMIGRRRRVRTPSPMT